VTSHFDRVRLPRDVLEARNDPRADGWDSGEDHRNEVLRVLLEAVHDGMVARFLHRRETGEREDSEEFAAAHWGPVWNGLRESLTRQDMLRWLMDWAASQVEDRVLETVSELLDGLEDFEQDGVPSWWQSERNPG
jgi:hypothetical protein